MSTILKALEKKKSEKINEPDVAPSTYDYTMHLKRKPAVRYVAILLAVCVILICGGIAALIFLKNPTPASTAGNEKIPQSTPIVAAAKPVQTPAEETPKPEPPTLRLGGIFKDSSGSEAIINNRIYRVGDTVEGAKLIKISDETVTIELNGETRELRSR